jgi:hypothetical protein
MYPDMPDGYAGWLLRHLKSKPLCLYSSILVLILCPLGLPLSSVMSVPSLKFIHFSASVQCPVVASSYSGSLAFDSRLRFCLGFSVIQNWCPTYFRLCLSSSVFSSVFSVVQSQFQCCLSAPRSRIRIPVHPCLRYSVKVVHVFVSGSSLFQVQYKGCPRLCFISSRRSSCIRQSRLS